MPCIKKHLYNIQMMNSVSLGDQILPKNPQCASKQSFHVNVKLIKVMLKIQVQQ